MSFVLLGILNSQASAVAQAYFLGILSGFSTDKGNDATLDSSGNFYIAGSSFSNSVDGLSAILAKYDSSGNLQFQKFLAGGDGEAFNGTTSDLLNNIYMVGNTNSVDANGDDALLAKYDSSGNLIFQKSLTAVARNKLNSVTVDSLNNFYVSGNSSPDGFLDGDGFVAKFDGSGIIQWQRLLKESVNDLAGTLDSIVLDSANNIYVSGQTERNDPTERNLRLAKYDNNGNLQWHKVLRGGSFDSFFGLAIDSANNVYACGKTNATGAGNFDAILVKFDSSGNLQWQKTLGGVESENASGIAIDQLDNIYIAGSTSSTGEGSNDLLIAKFDNLGNLQWQRVLGGLGNDSGASVSLDAEENLFLSGFSSSTGFSGTGIFFAKLTNDGSLQGTYSLDGNDIVYQPSTLTFSNSNLTVENGSVTSEASNLVLDNSAFTSSNATLTSATVTIG